MWRNEPRDTGKTPCNNGGRDWNEAASSQGMQWMTATSSSEGKRHSTESLSKFPGANLAEHLDSDFQLPELWGNRYMWFLSHQYVVLCHSSSLRLTWGEKMKWHVPYSQIPYYLQRGNILVERVNRISVQIQHLCPTLYSLLTPVIAVSISPLKI